MNTDNNFPIVYGVESWSETDNRNNIDCFIVRPYYIVKEYDLRNNGKGYEVVPCWSFDGHEITIIEPEFKDNKCINSIIANNVFKEYEPASVYANELNRICENGIEFRTKIEDIANKKFNKVKVDENQRKIDEELIRYFHNQKDEGFGDIEEAKKDKPKEINKVDEELIRYFHNQKDFENF